MHCESPVGDDTECVAVAQAQRQVEEPGQRGSLQLLGSSVATKILTQSSRLAPCTLCTVRVVPFRPLAWPWAGGLLISGRAWPAASRAMRRDRICAKRPLLPAGTSRIDDLLTEGLSISLSFSALGTLR